MERKEFKISITMKNAKKRNEGKGQQQEKKKQKTRGKIVTVARQRALNIVKSHVKMSKILPNLFLSSEKAVNEENVKQNNIKANVDLSKLRVVERRIKDSKKIKCLIIDVNDDPKQAAILQRNHRLDVLSYATKHRGYILSVNRPPLEILIHRERTS